MKYFDKILYQISLNFQHLDTDPDEIIGTSLLLLIKSLQLERSAVYFFDKKEKILRPVRVVTAHGEIEGEGEIYSDDKSNEGFFGCFSQNRELACDKPYPSVYFPLHCGKRKIGVLKIDNVFSGKKIGHGKIEKAKKFSNLLSLGIHNILNQKYYKKQVNKLITLTKTGNAISTTLRLEEVLKATLSSLVTDLGYDRAQIFLLDENTNKIKENLSVDFRGEFTEPKEAQPVIEAILYGSKPYMPLGKISSNLITYALINCKGKKSGVMVVDNLFSRQPLNEDDVSFLNMLSEQIASVIENSRLFGHVEKLSITDGLTGLYNHRYFYNKMTDELNRSGRFNDPMALMMLDLDYFKKFNDKYGHQAGDSVLSTVAGIIKNSIRSIDIASRYGGEEIAIILPETNIKGAEVIAERIRNSIKGCEFNFNGEIAKITVSIGLVAFPEDSKVQSELIKKADNALYWVKNNGRDGICVYSRCKELE